MAKGKLKFTAAQMVNAIEACNGGLFLAARKLGCSHETITNYRRRFPEVEHAITRCRGEAVDVAESSLRRGVLAGESWAVCFTLKCLGKDRGYIEAIHNLYTEVGLDVAESAEAGAMTQAEMISKALAYSGAARSRGGRPHATGARAPGSGRKKGTKNRPKPITNGNGHATNGNGHVNGNGHAE